MPISDVVTVTEDALHDNPIQVATAGELAALLAKLPPDTPLRVADHLRVDPHLEVDRVEDETVAAVTTISLSSPVRAERNGQVGPGIAIELGAYLVPRGARVPAGTVAFRPYERVIEGMVNGDAVRMVAACRALVDDVAGWLARSDTTLLELADDDPDLQDQLNREADWLAAARDRLALIESRFVALRESTNEQW